MQPDYLALARVVIAELPRLPQLGQLFRDSVPARVLRRTQELLDRGQAEGSVKIQDTEAAARLLVGSLLIDVLLDGLLAGEQRPRGPSKARIARVIALCVRAVT